MIYSVNRYDGRPWSSPPSSILSTDFKMKTLEVEIEKEVISFIRWPPEANFSELPSNKTNNSHTERMDDTV